MNINNNGNELIINYEMSERIRKITYNTSGECKVFDVSGEVISQFKTICTIGYNQQYGTPISNDEKLLFIGSWERGIFCYEILTGKLSWKKGPGKVRRIIVSEDKLIIEMCDRGIYQRDAKSGELLKEFKIPYCDNMYVLSDKEILVGPKRNQYIILSTTDLSIIKQFHWSMLNVNESLLFSINTAKIENDYLLINGVEQYRNREETDEERYDFERVISLKRTNFG